MVRLSTLYIFVSFHTYINHLFLLFLFKEESVKIRIIRGQGKDNREKT